MGQSRTFLDRFLRWGFWVGGDDLVAVILIASFVALLVLPILKFWLPFSWFWMFIPASLWILWLALRWYTWPRIRRRPIGHG